MGWEAVGKQEWTVISRNLHLMLPHLMLMVPECLSSALIKPPLLINPCSLTRVDRNSIMLLSPPSAVGAVVAEATLLLRQVFTASKRSCQDTRQEPPTPPQCLGKYLWQYKDGISKDPLKRLLDLRA